MKMNRWLGVGDIKEDEEVGAASDGKDDKVGSGRQRQGE